jgi:hypothetical protein
VGKVGRGEPISQRVGFQQLAVCGCFELEAKTTHDFGRTFALVAGLCIRTCSPTPIMVERFVMGIDLESHAACCCFFLLILTCSDVELRGRFVCSCVCDVCMCTRPHLFRVGPGGKPGEA